MSYKERIATFANLFLVCCLLLKYQQNFMVVCIGVLWLFIHW